MDILELLLFAVVAVVAGLVAVFIIAPVAGFWAGAAYCAVCGVVSGVLTSKRGDE